MMNTHVALPRAARHSSKRCLAHTRRWRSYAKEDLTPEALLAQVESGLGLDADGKSLKIDVRSKSVRTAAGDLPISPVLDPEWIKPRRRQTKPERRMPNRRNAEEGKDNEASALLGRFRRKLTMNPYALALATPLRTCSYTKVSLPRYFLQDFEVVQHPESGEVVWALGPLAFDLSRPEWTMESREVRRERQIKESEESTEKKLTLEEMMVLEKETAVEEEVKQEEVVEEQPGREADPVSEEESKKETTAEDSDTIPQASETTGHQTPSEGDQIQAQTPGTTEPPTPSSKSQSPLPGLSALKAPITVFALSRKSLLDNLSDPRFSSRLLQLRNGMAVDATVRPRISMRGDMADFLLAKYRRCAADALIGLGEMESFVRYKYLRSSKEWSSIGESARGSVLWIPPPDGPTFSAYATYDVRNVRYGAKVPVHDLKYLLGDEELDRLRREAGKIFEEGKVICLLGRRDQRLNRLHLLLWRLQGYLAPLKEDTEVD